VLTLAAGLVPFIALLVFADVFECCWYGALVSYINDTLVALTIIYKLSAKCNQC